MSTTTVTNRAPALGRRVNAIRPHAERVIDEYDSVVILDLSPIGVSVIRDIAHALARDERLTQLITIARSRHSDPEVADAQAAILASLIKAGALQIELSSIQASELSFELDEASVEPEVCEVGSCDLLASVGHAYCVYHLEVVL